MEVFSRTLFPDWAARHPGNQGAVRVGEVQPGIAVSVGGVAHGLPYRHAGVGLARLHQFQRSQIVRSVAGQHLHGGDQLGAGVHNNRRFVPVVPSTAAKEAAGYLDGENSRELQARECEKYCEAHGLEITAGYYDAAGSSNDFERIIENTTVEGPPFDSIIVQKLKNFSWSIEETVLCRDRLSASGVRLIQATESPALGWAVTPGRHPEPGTMGPTRNVILHKDKR